MNEDEDALGGLDPGWIRSLGHPIRVAILRRMLDGEVTTPAALAAELKLSLPVVGYHVRFLSNAQQLTLVRSSQRRGAVVLERAETDPPFTVLLGMAQALGITLEEVFTSAES